MEKYMNETTRYTLPELLRFTDGRPVTSPAEWRARRGELLAMLQELAFGHLPPAPARVSAYFLHEYDLSPEEQIAGKIYRITAEPYGLSLLVKVITPHASGPFPVIIDGDEGWRYLTNEVQCTVARRGYALALFHRVEIAPDNGANARDFGLYTACPEGDFGALAAWAWGYHRVVDFVLGLEHIDSARIAVTGHSRGGKAALLAGATDERIALTAPNNSGCGGSGCLRYPDDGGERLANILRAFPYWFSPRLADYIGREQELPFDLHSLKALVAPRALLTTEALGDLWASPRGTWLTHAATREVYRFLEAEDALGIYYREGQHEHSLSDWKTLLDFADARFFGKPALRDFQANPWG